MAHHKSAKKRIRVVKRKTELIKKAASKIKTFDQEGGCYL